MKIEITTKLPATQKLGEIYQSMKTKQALVIPAGKNTFERITPYVLCRDFLVDVYTFSEAKKAFEIYGMSFDGKNNSPSWDGVYMLQQFPDENIQERFLRHVERLNELEADNHIPQTHVTELTPTEVLIVGHKQWLTNCLYFSLYTLLLRGLSYDTKLSSRWWKDLGQLKTTDGVYFKSIAPETWVKICDALAVLNSPYFCGLSPKEHPDYVVHHNSGIISVLGKHSEQHHDSVRKNKHWALLRQRGLTTYVDEKKS